MGGGGDSGYETKLTCGQHKMGGGSISFNQLISLLAHATGRCGSS